MDIVERLKQEFSGNALKDIAGQIQVYVKERHEAADEIDHLRQYISELEDAIASNNPTEIFNKSARLEGLLTALKEGE